ncbi:cyclin-like protein [Pseudomassariella vexata]|uniref:Cyclin-like protein n=1 Tax=Pseudomassariella vexata TaxID=1141098 RepID=A0A1Y2EKH7_9PEZI|nr:cyclin-like protein [Pseudomassariella vexata]ORY71804.1 cyclin-like protein [Pseudomassariella vexata]
MDAKPYRPVRGHPTAGNENLPAAKQSIQHRNKSVGSLLNQPTTGALQVAAKRTALGDRSNNATKSLILRDDSKMSKGAISAAGAPASTTMITKAKENQVEGRAAAKDAFLRPAQRPASKAASILPSTSNGYIMPLHAGASNSHLPSQIKVKPVPKRATTMVYNDKNDLPQLNALEEAHYKSLTGADREEFLATRRPRHHQSQPSLKPEKQNLRRQTSSISQQYTSIADPRPSNAYPAGDDITETPYLDAVEELPQEDQYPVQELEEGTLPPLPSLSAPGNGLKGPTKMVDLLSEDPVELSDYEEEDYYDDQGYTTAHSNRSRGDNTTGGGTTIMFPPKLTKKGAAEIEAAKEIVESKRNAVEADEEAWDISMVAEYGDEIFGYMKELEQQLLPNAHYMEIQTEIQWSMRSVLMDWVIQVHGRFGLLPETLFLAVNYIDRFLSYKIVSLGKLQLVGATALFVAAKYEEINCPSVQEIVYMVDSGYTVDEVLKAERFMLSMLNFELGWPGPMSFLRRISKADDYDLETRTLAKYFIEVTIMDERFVATPPSYVAAGAHCLSRLMLGKGDWTPEHVHYSTYTYNQLKPLVGMMLDCCRMARRHHGAVFDKYCDKRYKRAACFVEQELTQGYGLPFQAAPSLPISFNLLDDMPSHDSYAPPHTTLKMPIPSQG